MKSKWCLITFIQRKNPSRLCRVRPAAAILGSEPKISAVSEDCLQEDWHSIWILSSILEDWHDIASEKGQNLMRHLLQHSRIPALEQHIHSKLVRFCTVPSWVDKVFLASVVLLVRERATAGGRVEDTVMAETAKSPEASLLTESWWSWHLEQQWDVACLLLRCWGDRMPRAQQRHSGTGVMACQLGFSWSAALSPVSHRSPSPATRMDRWGDATNAQSCEVGSRHSIQQRGAWVA